MKKLPLGFGSRKPVFSVLSVMTDDYTTTEDGLKVIDYTTQINNIRRISHEVEGIDPPPTPEELAAMNPDKARQEINRQIRMRKRIMAGLDTEIEELREVRKKL